MTSKLELDPRIDPRIKTAFAGVPVGAPQADVASREELLAQELSAEGKAAYARQVAVFDSMDREDVAPSAGLAVRTLTFTSAPDGNTVQIQYIRPEGDEVLPCIYYIHGGRMAFSSCYEGNYKAWGRMIAARGLAVDGRLPQRRPRRFGTGNRALSSWAQRLRLGPRMGARPRGCAWH